MASAYLVIGDTGEYSDYTSWPVAAYLDRDQATRHADLANEQIKAVNPRSYEARVEFMGAFALDRDCQMDYTGTEYSVVEVPLTATVEEYQSLPRRNP